MSSATPSTIVQRIRPASPGSRIAVFQDPRPGWLRAVFADTVTTRAEIVRDPSGLIGCYDGSENLAALHLELEAFSRIASGVAA